jgi:membrane protein YdbS with pleckstrin-like domain
MADSEDMKQVRRLLASIVALLGLLNVLAAVGLYFRFVPRPLEKLLTALPVVLIVGVVTVVLVIGTGFVRSLVAAQRPQGENHNVKMKPGIEEKQQHSAG